MTRRKSRGSDEWNRAREESHTITVEASKPHNLDKTNLKILKAELQNLELGKDTHTPQEKARYEELKKTIADIEKNGTDTSNPNTQKRTDRK